jgi:photosystem II stability/assembly factor-like uncharacterized protein
MNQERFRRWLRIGLVAAVALIAATKSSVALAGREDDDGDGDAPYPNVWFMAQRAFPHEGVDQKTRFAAFAAADRFLRTGQIVGDRWQLVGPTNVGGRITAIDVSPAKPQRVFLGTANGGVFRSDDGGTTWASVFGDQASLSIGAVAIDPADADRIWVGTGEANSSGSTYAGTGIYRSDDGGETWKGLGLLESQHIGRIAVSPTDSSTVFVAALGDLFSGNPERGVYVTHDAGASWQLALHTDDLSGAVDVAIDPGNPQNVYAALWQRLHKAGELDAGGPGSGIYASHDGGATWSQATSGLPASGPTTGRIGIAVSAAAIYAIFDDTKANFNGVYRSTDGAKTFTRTKDAALAGIDATYGWWYGNIRIDPTDSNRVYAIGFSAYMSADGGDSWNAIGPDLHPDMHALYIDPTNPQRLLLGDDGGFFQSSDQGKTWSGPPQMPITQFYAVSIDPNHPERIYGGAQDNGVVATQTGQSDDWKAIWGGDGFQVQIDPRDNGVLYTESQNGDLVRIDPTSPDGREIAPSATRANWNTPILLDPNNPDTLYYGADRLWKSPDGGSTWAAVSPDLSVDPTTGPQPRDTLVAGTITVIGIAKSDSRVIYCGTDNGKLWGTQDAGAHWALVDKGLPGRWVTGIAIDPQTPGNVVATVSGYRDNDRLAHVYASADFGAHWRAIDGGLPEVPVNVVRQDPGSPTTFYVGTDTGIYLTTDLGAHWAVLGQNLPVSPIIDLALDAAHHQLIAATFGRSIWRLPLGR